MQQPSSVGDGSDLSARFKRGRKASSMGKPTSRQRHRRRPRYRPRAWRQLIASSTGKRKRSSCQQDSDGDSRAGKMMKSSIPDLPEELLFHIHSLMPMREAARAACASHAFLHSWRCYYPNLIFSKDTIGLKKNGRGQNFHHKIDRLLKNRSGTGLKTFNLDYSGMRGFHGNSYFDSWLQIALKPGIEKLTLWLPITETIYNFHKFKKIYNFPCSLLSDGVRNSLKYLKLRFAAFHPIVEIGPLVSLTSLHLSHVNINWDELNCLLCNSLALEQLELKCCAEIICLKVPCALQRLSSLSVVGCERLAVIESKAPNLSSLCLSTSRHRLDFSLVETLQLKKLAIDYPRFIGDASAMLPNFMPNLETLDIISHVEVVDAPMLPTKFLNLKHLNICLPNSRPYDYLSLVSFLGASPSLETLVLTVPRSCMMHESIFVDSQLRDMPDRRHGSLHSVKICGFSSAKCLVELACYIVKSAVSLVCLTLDTTYGPRCGQGKYRYCHPIAKGVLMEAPRALSAIRTYIRNNAPSTVKLTVLGPCSRCHGGGI